MGGYLPDYEESGTDVRPATRGVPFEFAVKAALEELAGCRGDIKEGDSGGQLEDNPNAYQDLNDASDRVEKMTAEDCGGTSVTYDGEKKKVLDALLAEGGEASYQAMIEMDDLAYEVQKYLEGKKVTLDDLLETAATQSPPATTFLEAFGIMPDASPSP